MSRPLGPLTPALLWLVLAAPVTASGAIALPADGRAYAVAQLVPRYVRDHPQLPPLGAILATRVELGEVDDGYVAPRAELPSRELPLRDLASAAPTRYYASALAAINRTILGALNDRGLAGVRVRASPLDIDAATGEDRRDPRQRTLRVDIEIGRIEGLRVVEVDTLAGGERVPAEQAVDNPLHRRIVEHSPIQPSDAVREGTTDLLRIDLLEDYVARLNRYPRRNVVAEVSPSHTTPGSAYLEYRILEARPWTVYAQVSRTGTEETHRWRNRFGFRHTQLRGEDDTLQLDYVTGGDFGDVHGLFLSYESPFAALDRLRWQVSALYSEYQASELGLNNATFEGREHAFGMQLIANVFQRRRFFVDLIGEIRWHDIEVKDGFFNLSGNEDMFIPRVRLRAEIRTDAVQVHADVGWERSLGGGSSLEKLELQRLGRVDPDDRWQILRWDAGLSFFVEPFLSRVLPGRVEAGARIHEIRLSSSGQEAFDNRLIPQFETVVGGMRTVRGYPQAVLAGDSVSRGTVENRLHLMRLLGPDTALGRVLPLRRVAPDSDLVLTAFVDVARVRQSQRRPGEFESSLFGAGLGAELWIRKNVNLSYSFGVALRDLKDPTGARDRVERGDAEHHLAVTLTY